MADFVQHPVVQALAWALVHFVWQGTAIGLAAFLALRTARPSSARYAIGVGALALMLAAPVATFVILTSSPATVSTHQQPVPTPAAPAPPAPVRPDQAAPAQAPFRVSPEMLAITVLSWLGGVAFFSIRLLGGWVVARGVARRTVKPAADAIQQIARDLSARLGVRRAVRILESTAIAVPVMVGWLKPAIVLPVAALASLTPSQLEALIAHELAHVRRHDYLVNVLQSVAEAVLFYHPAVWWLSRQVRSERELCCDDLAVGVCDRLVYATALTDLATLATPRLALAATDGNLLHRVRRILGQADEAAAVRAGLMPVLALALAAAVAVPAALASGTPASAAASDQARTDMPLVGQVAVAVTPERTEMAFDRSEAQQSAEQADRQGQIEELRRKIVELQKALADLSQERVPEANARSQQDVQALIAAQERMARVKQEEIQKLVEKMSQTRNNNEEQRRVMEGMLADLAKLQRDERVRAARTADAQSLDRLASEREAAQRAYDDEKRRYLAGMSTQQDLNAAETALKRAQAAGDPQALAAINMADAEKQLARAKALHDKGLVSEAQMRDAEIALKKLQAGGDLAAIQSIEMQEARAKLDRANELWQKGLIAQPDVEQARRDVQQLEQRLSITIDGRDLALVDPRLGSVESRLGVMQPAADQNQAVKGGDILRITIQAEPDLPSTYEVTADGTIRLPFLAATKVAGLTAADIRTAVGKQLSDRKLGSADRVTVTLMRR